MIVQTIKMIRDTCNKRKDNNRVVPIGGHALNRINPKHQKLSNRTMDSDTDNTRE